MNQATTGKRTSLSQPCSQGSTLDHWWSHVNRLRLVTNDGKLLQHRLAWICYRWRIAVLRPTTLALQVLDWTSDFCNPTLLNHDPQGFRCLLVGLSPQPKPHQAAPDKVSTRWWTSSKPSAFADVVPLPCPRSEYRLQASNPPTLPYLARRPKKQPQRRSRGNGKLCSTREKAPFG